MILQFFDNMTLLHLNAQGMVMEIWRETHYINLYFFSTSPLYFLYFFLLLSFSHLFLSFSLLFNLCCNLSKEIIFKNARVFYIRSKYFESNNQGKKKNYLYA
jgi:hypothetical protein